MRILVVEEHDSVATGLSDAIEQCQNGAEVVRSARLGPAELMLKSDNEFDVALIAIGMPNGESANISARLKTLCPGLVIIVVTGEDSPEMALDLIRLGIQDCIPRYEVTPRRLLRTIEIARERHYREQQLRKLACTDTLTGLLNRRGLVLAATDLHRTALKMNEVTALMTIDLDEFKPLNDRFGHPVGDMILKTSGRRIAHCIRDNDVVGRAGGDEFWVILNCVGQAANAIKVAAKVLKCLETPMLLDGEIIDISASIGIALLPYHCTTVDEWVRKSDQALYEAKRSGRNRWSMFTLPRNGRRPGLSDEMPQLAC